MTVRFVAQRVPLVDPKTGIISREWYLLFQQLFNFSTGVDDNLINLIAPASNPDVINSALFALADQLSVSPVSISATPSEDDVVPVAQNLYFSADDVLPLIWGLNDQIAMLRSEVNDLRQGTIS